MIRYIIVSFVSGILFGTLDGVIHANPLALRLYEVYKPIARTSFNPLAGILIFFVLEKPHRFDGIDIAPFMVGEPGGDYSFSRPQWEEALDYIAAHPEVRDVILSGGDPLMLTDFMLEKIISGLRDIPHVEIIRLGTKMPCVLPQRITPKLVKMLRKYHPVWLNTHFNHPNEITAESKRAVEMLVDAGIQRPENPAKR